VTHPYPAAPPQQPQYPAAPQGYAPPQQPQGPQQYAPNPYAQQAPQYAPQQPQPQQYAPNPYAHPQTVQNYPGPAGYPYGYPQQPQQPQAPAPEPVQASLGDFYSQPSTGWGPCVTPGGKAPDGWSVVLVVATHITAAHIEHATKFQSETELDYYRNGKPKLVMKIPAYVAPGLQYTTGQGAVQTVADGRAQYFVQGGDKDLLAAAMATQGAPAGPPELGAVIRVTKTHSRPTRSGTMSAVRTFEYWRPGPESAGFAAQLGIQYPDLNTPKPVDAPPAAPPVHQAPQGAPLPPPPAAPPAPQAPAAPPAAPQAPAAPPAAPQQFAPPAAPPAPAAVGELDPERQALLAKLTGQPVG
jgi:hypothetical protein